MRQLIARVLGAFTSLLYQRTILVLTLLFCVGIAGALWNIHRLSQNLIKSQALQNASLYAQAIKESRTLYSSEVVNRIQPHGITITHDYALKEAAIPLPATFLIELGQHISKNNPGMSVRLYSDYPFPWRRAEGGPKDDFERDALRYLRSHPDRPFFRFQQFQNRPSLRYAIADLMQPSCIGCHNTYPGTPKKDWQVGDLRGVLEITHPLDRFIKNTRDGLRGTFTTLAILSVLGVSGLTLVIGRLRRTSQELERRVIERTAALQEANTELANEISERKQAEVALRMEQEKSERLLLNILPHPIAQKLKHDPTTIAELFTEATILFADLVNFTQLSAQISPTALVELLNEIFSRFDQLTDYHQLEKIKTIGDAYMVV
ncbi:MAG TPA: adenylate/guanylate cyclase, partial [Cyanobacteria bacterium UBA9273]|nr:adenylate/guanylate cyclase [Cyanobacteria bacterium UBA9273]